MLLHRMARYAMTAARAQHISRRDGFRSTAGIKRHAHALRIIFDRRHFGAKFDLKAEALQMFAQDRLGAPLRKAALKLVRAPGVSEVLPRDFVQTRT